MNLPQLPTLPEAKEKAVTWLSRNLYIVLGVIGGVLTITALILFLGVRGMEKAAENNPPMSRDAAKEIIKNEKKAEIKADSAIQAAVVHERSADSSKKVAIKAIQSADSSKAKYEKINPDPSTPLSDIERRWTKYESPFRRP